MHKFLVAIDSSEPASRALAYAIGLARETGGSLHLVFAHEPPVIYGEVALYLPVDAAEDAQAKLSQSIIEPAAASAKAAGVPFTTEFRIGEVGHEIAGAAESTGCDAIIMGTRGMGSIGNLVMGSTATKVIHLSKVPVTLVK